MIWCTHILPWPSIHSTSLHLRTLHFTPLYCSFGLFPSYLHLFAIFITFLTFFPKLLGLQERGPKASAGSWFQSWMVLFTEEYFPIPVFCFLLLIFVSWSPLLGCHGLCSLSPITFQARSPVYALTRARVRAIFLRSVKVSELESFLWCANLAAMFCTGSSAFICPFRWGSQHAAPYSRIFK
jgi:hypothetical protein